MKVNETEREINEKEVGLEESVKRDVISSSSSASSAVNRSSRKESKGVLATKERKCKSRSENDYEKGGREIKRICVVVVGSVQFSGQPVGPAGQQKKNRSFPSLVLGLFDGRADAHHSICALHLAQVQRRVEKGDRRVESIGEEGLVGEQLRGGLRFQVVIVVAITCDLARTGKLIIFIFHLRHLRPANNKAQQAQP